MYSLDIHSGHRHTSQVGKCGLYTSEQPEQQKKSTVSFSNHENCVQYKSHNGPNMAVDNNNT